MKSLEVLRNYARWCGEDRTADLLRMAGLIKKELLERYLELPVDAGGVPIHIGDVMEGELIGGGYGEPFEVVGYVMSNGELEPMNEHKCPHKHKYLRHHQEPTVEDVLREFGKAWVEWMDGSPLDPIAEYAKKLRLAGDE